MRRSFSPDNDRSWITILLYWLPPLVFEGLIFKLSSGPVSIPLPFLDFPHADKVVHMLEYTLLGFLIARAVLSTLSFGGLRGILFSIFLTFLLGCTDEFHQAFVPTRYADLLDLGSDGIGAVLGVLAYAHATRARRAERTMKIDIPKRLGNDRADVSPERTAEKE